MNCPKAPIPESLRGIETGTFTHKSIVERLPNTGRRMLAENNFSVAVAGELEALLAQIPAGNIQPLADAGAPDAEAWAGYISPYLDQNWLEVPWFFVETYFYRRVLAITNYFQQGPGEGRDPFLYQKRQGLETSRVTIRGLCRQLDHYLEQTGSWQDQLIELLAIDLWGNQADLSLWPADEDEKPDHRDIEQQQAHTLVDDSAAVVAHLSSLERPVRIDLILDNAGFELVADIVLALFVLEQGSAGQVHLHAKKHPTFVSDATMGDVWQTVFFLMDEDDPLVSTTGRRLLRHLNEGRLRLQSDWFWTSPLEMWQMPAGLTGELAHSDLLIFKGDANYRRLLGDRHWSFTTPFADIVCYLPAPVLALRTLKSEIIVGLKQGQSEATAAKDPSWLFDGRWSVIQFFKP
jgi:uncharacterized protein with ATP-grasp and redox domains